MNILTQKIGALIGPPKNKMAIFLKKAPIILIEVQ
jgi:hypothetical protein